MADLSVNGVSQGYQAQQVDDVQSTDKTTRDESISIYNMEENDLQSNVWALGIEKELDNILYSIEHSKELDAIKQFKTLCNRLESDPELAGLARNIVYSHSGIEKTFSYSYELVTGRDIDSDKTKEDNLKTVAYYLLQTRLDEKSGEHVDIRDYITDNCTDSNFFTYIGSAIGITDEADVLREICGM